MDNRFDLYETQLNILEKCPEWGELMRVIAFKNIPEADPAGYGDKTIYYNRGKMRLLPQAEQEYMIAQQLMHIQLAHRQRGRGRNRQIWEEACNAVINELLVDDGFEPPAFIRQLQEARGLSAEEMYDILYARAEDDETQPKDLSEEDIIRLTYEKEAEYRRRLALDDKICRLVDGLVGFLDALKAAGIPMTIATGSEKNNVDFYFSSEKLGLTRWFDRDLIVYDDDSFPGKPAPDIYLKAAAKIGVDPSRCAVFEDSFSGVCSARAAGAAFVGAVGRGAVPEKFNSAGGVDLAMEDFSGWRELLFTLFAIKAE